MDPTMIAANFTRSRAIRGKGAISTEIEMSFFVVLLIVYGSVEIY
jgi:hypothetical protein